jgi:hypothetical protein
VPPPGARLDVGHDMLDVLCSEMLFHHRRFTIGAVSTVRRSAASSNTASGVP